MDTLAYRNALYFARDENDKTKVDYLMNVIKPGKNESIPNPFYGSMSASDNTYEILQEACKKIADELEKKRQETAQRLMGLGPLSLDICLITSLEFNDRIQASRAAIRAVGGDELIAMSRFLPHLSYDLTASVTQNLGSNVMMGFLATQELLEFGKDNPIDVALRELQRRQLFSYEGVVAGSLSNVRLRFYTILLRQQQLAQRRMLRDEFAASYDKMVRRATEGRVVVTDVLTAEQALEKAIELGWDK